MKKININSQQTHFIGCWNLENNKLCNEIIHFFENNKELQTQGITSYGKDLKAKKYYEKTLNLDSNHKKTCESYGIILLKLNQHSKALTYLGKGSGFIRFTEKNLKII